MPLILKERIDEVDSKYWSPSERATGVYNLLFNHLKELKEKGVKDLPTHHDVFCFAIEYIAQQSIGIANAELIQIAKEGVKWLYNLHYTYAENIFEAPDKIVSEDVKETMTKQFKDIVDRTKNYSKEQKEELAIIQKGISKRQQRRQKQREKQNRKNKNNGKK